MGDLGWWAFGYQSVETRVGVTGSCGHVPTPKRDGTGLYSDYGFARGYGATLCGVSGSLSYARPVYDYERRRCSVGVGHGCCGCARDRVVGPQRLI